MADGRGLHRVAADRWEARRRASLDASRWRLARVAPSVEAGMVEAEDAGVLDPSLLDEFEAHVVAAFEEELSRLDAPGRAMGRGLSSALLDGRLYKNRLDRQLAVGSEAAARLAVDQATYVVASEVVRRLVLGDAVLGFAFPAGAVVVGPDDDAGPSREGAGPGDPRP